MQMRNSSLRPQLPVQAPVLDGFRDVVGLDGLGVREVRDGARDLEHPVVGAGGEVEFFDGLLEQGLGGIGLLFRLHGALDYVFNPSAIYCLMSD